MRYSFLVLAMCALAAQVLPPMGLQSASAADEKIPEYSLDSSWPKLPLPNNWALGLINGIHVDAKNHLWMFHSPELVPNYARGAAANPPTNKCCVPAPAIIEFDEAGNVLRAWGGPEQAKDYDWPTAGHGLYVDYKGNVWIGGSQTRVDPEGGQPDGMYLKFSPEGKLLLQIGGRGPSKGSLDPTRLSGASSVDVDPETNEAFIADGYGNHRVIVFDADTGAFKRQWGAYGKPPTDEKLPRYDGGPTLPKQFNLVHCIRIANDGLVYVCDRLNNRLQVFRKNGTFVTEYVYEPQTKGSGSVGNVSFWPDAKQTIMVMNDPGNFETVLIRRTDGQVLSRFGHYGTWAGEYHRNHQMEFDLKGNIYTSEDNRVQRLKIVNGVQP
jgi:DNA-binding beta-propeller fold protein YncE